MFRRRDLLQKISQQFDAEESANAQPARHDETQGDLMAYGNQYVGGAQADVPVQEPAPSRSQIVTPQPKPASPMTLADHFARQANVPASRTAPQTQVAEQTEPQKEMAAPRHQAYTAPEKPRYAEQLSEPRSHYEANQMQQAPVMATPPAAHPAPAAERAAPTATPMPTNENIQPSMGGAKNMLTVGPETILKGEINTCDRVVIEGKVEAIMKEVRVLEIGQGGRFQGNATVESAEIDGEFDGELHVTGKLIIRNAGMVSGTVTYGEIEIANGGRLAGNIGTQPSQDMRPKLAAV